MEQGVKASQRRNAIIEDSEHYGRRSWFQSLLDMTKLVHMRRPALSEISTSRLGIAKLQDTQNPLAQLSEMPMPLAVDSITTDLHRASKRRRLDLHLERHENKSQSQPPYTWSEAERDDIVVRTTTDGDAGLAQSAWLASHSRGRPQIDFIDAASALGTNASMLQPPNSEETTSEENRVINDHFEGQQYEVNSPVLETNAHGLQDIFLAPDFEPGITNILHRAAAADSTTLAGVLEFMQQGKIDIDLLDDQGFTALHLAIKNGHIESMRSLLDAGASINRQGRTTALHVAVAAVEFSGAIIHVLLDHGASSYVINHAGSSSLEVLVNRLNRHGPHGRPELTRCMLDAISALLQKGSIVDSEHDGIAFETFIDWFQSIRDPRWYYGHYGRDGVATLDTFLAKGYSPLHEVTVHSCPGYCRTFAEFAAFHHHSDAPWRSIARSSCIDTHILNLARRLLRSCPHRTRGSSSPKCMEMLPWQGAHFTAEDSTDLLHELLDQTYTGSSDDNQAILQMWLDRGLVTDVHALKGRRRPLETYLDNEDVYFRQPHLGLVMSLLSADKGLSTAKTTQVDNLPESLFCYHPGLHYRKYMEPDYGCHLLQYHSASVDSMDLEELHWILRVSWQCVIHVLTVHLIADDLDIPRAGTRSQRILFAAMVRKEAKLPPIPIDHDILIEAIEGASDAAGYVTAYEGRWERLKASLQDLAELNDLDYDEDEDLDEDWT
ncbi:hypothetical protein LTR86_009083 [Recurvomyces mirabilis]|nr:hypothetical protein LTR86_009083 [Recurvomyces mirabilis]